jgi:hypothetical protein
MKYFYLLFSMLLFFSNPSFAQSTANSEQVKLSLIQQMTKDGFLSEKMSIEATKTYIDTKKLKTPGAETSVTVKANTWSQYFSFINFIKVTAIILLLFCFSGTIKKIIQGAWHLIIQVPIIIYQTSFLTVSLICTIFPTYLWAAEAFYIALFGAFANLIIIGWILEFHPKLVIFLKKLFNIGLPIETIISFWGMLYFSLLAVAYHSQIFGFFATVCLSGIFSFTLYYSSGTLWLFFKDNALSALVFGHAIVLIIYSILHTTGNFNSYLPLFQAGLEFYCTIALGTGLLVGSAPWGRGNKTGLYLFIAITLFVMSIFGFFFLDLKVIGSIMTCFIILIALEWIAYMGFLAGFIIGTGVSGALLYGVALALEKYGHLLFLNLGIA